MPNALTSFRATVSALALALGLAAGLPAAVQAQNAPAKPAAVAKAAPPSAEETAVRKRFTERFDGAEVDEVRRTPYGLFELRLGSQLIYTDAKVSYVLQGNLIDTESRRNVTRERMEELLAVRFDELPLELAIKRVRGTGARKVALFEDPNCGYCKQLRRAIEDIDDVTIYTFVYPVLGDDSVTKARHIWCSADAAQVWDDWMVRNKTPKRTAGCDTSPIDKTVALGQKLQVTGTPTIIFSDDTRVGGAIPAEQFKAKLDAIAKG